VPALTEGCAFITAGCPLGMEFNVSTALDCLDIGIDVIVEDDMDGFELSWGLGGFNAFAELTEDFRSSENSGRR